MSRAPQLVYEGEHLRALAMPLGGIGCGQVAICGDGGLRQWQIFNNICHYAHVPHSFFAVRAQMGGAEPVARVLMSASHYDDAFAPAPAASDHVVAEASRRLLATQPGVARIRFIGEYPFAELQYEDDALPIAVSLEAFSPFIPLDAEDSGLPVVVFAFRVENRADSLAAVSLLMTQQNAVGWDGETEIKGVRHAAYGGNRNKPFRSPSLRGVEMTNLGLPADHPRWGQMVVAVCDPNASVRARWTDLGALWRDFVADGALSSSGSQPSQAGRTVNSAVCTRLAVEPGSTGSATFLLAWWFPNRQIDWLQPGFDPADSPKGCIGNHYAVRFPSARAVADYVADNLRRLTDSSRRFREALHDTTLPMPLLDAVSSQVSVIRSPTCFRTEDGRFYGFEGCRGASTPWEGFVGGAGPLNCTHVWNYEMAVARLFPALERTMRDTEWRYQQHPSGYLPHRVVLPLTVPRPWSRPSFGPVEPALDGLLGAVLKTYREYLASGDVGWLRSLWPNLRLALEYVMSNHDRGDGVIDGPQPNTYDVAIEGPNTFIGSLYLAALRAAEEMAGLLGEREDGERYRQRFESGREAMERELWHGEYYVHRFDPATQAVMAYGEGCHSDQLLGQWWAYVLGLGHLFDPERVREALASIHRYNFKKSMEGLVLSGRRFLRDDEAGLLNCSWPKGGRPLVPLLYSDEVWTGIEYAVAGAMLFAGMVDEALEIVAAVRSRQDGRLRSPWNDIEYGDHYVRAMSSWALLEATAGYRYDAAAARMAFAPRIGAEDFRCLFVASEGWGRYWQRLAPDAFRAELHLDWGRLTLRELALAVVASELQVTVQERVVAVDTERQDATLTLRFVEPVTLVANQALSIEGRAG
ncbi:MAG: GH116 family glycosyl-hydrolase [Dehalococcoidia bacterium]